MICYILLAFVAVQQVKAASTQTDDTYEGPECANLHLKQVYRDQEWLYYNLDYPPILTMDPADENQPKLSSADTVEPRTTHKAAQWNLIDC